MRAGDGLKERKPSVKAFVRPYDFWHDFYQAYYREGLRLHLEEIKGRFEIISTSRFPRLLRSMRRVRDAYKLRPFFDRAKWLASAVDALGHKIEGEIRTPSTFFYNAAGQYLINTPDNLEYKICIDSSDYGELRNPDLVAWSDIYFKTNFWPTLEYPANVVPLVNGDPMVMPRIPAFRSYRKMEKQYDLCFIVRVWGGTGDVSEGVEHNIRLLEAAARLDCKKYLLAYLVAGDIEAYARRLTEQGIPWTTQPLPPDELWKATAQSRLNVIRLGVHYCIPWRLTGSLATGSCIVLDRAPLTVWPHPLLEGTNFLDLGVETAPDQALAHEDQYAAIPDKLALWLADTERVAQIAANNGEYFDRFLHPERVGAYVLEKVSELEKK